MKKYFFLILSVLTIGTMNSCSDDDDNNAPIVAPEESLGTAKRSGDIDVNWIQLWAGGPKFAEYNVGRLDKKTTILQMLDLIKVAYAKAKQEGKPAIYDFGWNYQTFDGVGPTLGQLDEACPDIPLFVYNDDGEMGFANSACMLKTGIIDADGRVIKSEIRGGEVGVDELGNLTGLVMGQACDTCITFGIGADYLLLIGGKAEDLGGYYCWGSSINKDPEASYKKGESDLSGADDTATDLWGSNWRMPTEVELQALLDNCNTEWTTVNGVKGCKFTGKGDYVTNSVFFPAASYSSPSGSGQTGTNGNYWSSAQLSDDRALYLGFVESMAGVFDNSRNLGYSVRAVLAE